MALTKGSIMKNNKLYAGLALFALASLVSSFWQLLDKIELLKHPGSSLSCNLNSVFNCTRVLDSHQYNVFGFPNAMIGIIMFTFFLTVGIIGLSGSRLAKNFALTVHGLALFMLGFILWFIWQSTYNIHALCLFCSVIGPSVLLINVLILRINRPLMPAKIQTAINRGVDLFVWSLLLIGVIFAVAVKFN